MVKKDKETKPEMTAEEWLKDIAGKLKNKGMTVGTIVVLAQPSGSHDIEWYSNDRNSAKESIVALADALKGQA